MNLLFDLDGTLADPMEAFAGSLDYAYDQLKLPRLPREEMRKLIGPPLHTLLPRLCPANKIALVGSSLGEDKKRRRSASSA